MINPDQLQAALTETDWHCNQVQGFCYKVEPDLERHVVRDLTKRPGDQTLWQETATRSNYSIVHERMIVAIDQKRVEIITERLNAITAK